MKAVLKWKSLVKRPPGRPQTKTKMDDKVKMTLEEFGIQDMEVVTKDRQVEVNLCCGNRS